MSTKNFIGAGGQFSWGKINPGKCPLELKAYILPRKIPLRKLPQGGGAIFRGAILTSFQSWVMPVGFKWFFAGLIFLFKPIISFK